jgi:imidazole glycerol phosphate synthase subunit HisF
MVPIGTVELFFEVFTKFKAETAFATGIFLQKEMPIGAMKKQV